LIKRILKDTNNYRFSSDLSDLPIVVYLGYSIHGNESSGTGAAIALAYYLAAAESPELENTRKNYYFTRSSFNPDGLHRFSRVKQ
jgi:hypothetical protein